MTDPAVQTIDATATNHKLSTRRLNIMRCGYAFMGVGLAIVKWPILVQNVSALPLFEGVEACLLTGMSLLAFLGLRYPVAMLPILLFEVTWKAIWIAAVAVPHLVADDLAPQHVTCWSTAPLSSSLSRSSRGDMSGSATSAHQGMRGVDERHPAVTCRPSSPKGFWIVPGRREMVTKRQRVRGAA